MRQVRYWCGAGILALGIGLASTATGQEGEDVKAGDLQDQPGTVSSPTLVDPLWQCGSDVLVRGGIRHAELTVYVNGTPQGSAEVRFAETAVHLAAPLVAGDSVTVTQKRDGVESAPSPAVVVRDHSVEFPDGPPQSSIFPAVVYQCGVMIADLGHLNGSLVSVFRNLAHAGTWAAPGEWTNLPPDGGPFAVGEAFETEYAICGDMSPRSDTVLAIPQPPVVPPPVIDPSIAIEGQEVLTVSHLLEGALARVKVSGIEIGTGATAIDWLPFDAEGWLGHPLRAGDVLSATQELCDVSMPSTPVTVQPCSSLPAPRIAAPAIGDEIVTVTRSQPGARIHVHDASGAEIGDGAAPSVRLYRALVAGDVIRVTQSFDTCAGRLAYQIPIRCSPFDTIDDRSLAGAAPTMPMDYDVGTIVLGSDTTRVAATVRLPVTPDQQLTPGLHPILFILHGNHGTGRRPTGEDVCGVPGLPEAPSFRGYDYLLDALARSGYIAVSINGNDLNCLSGRISERAELIREHVRLWQRAADPADPSPPFGGRFVNAVDFGRVVLAGHSRGGEAAVVAATRGVGGAIIRGVIAVAPTDNLGAVLDGIPYFGVIPANDLDVVGNDGVAIHDRARGPAGWFRSYVYIHDANHNFFNREWRSHDGCALGGSRMARATQEPFLRALGLEFADAVIGRRSRFRDIATERARVAGLTSTLAFWSYQRGDDALVDDHQDGNAARNRLGDGVDASGFTRFQERSFDAGAGALNGSFLHDTQGLLAEWTPSSPAQFISKLPPGAIRTEDFEVVAVRMAQVGAAGAPGASPLRAELTVRDRGGRSARVNLDGAARVPRSYRRDIFTCGTDLTEDKTVMTSVRVPLACFTGDGKPVDTDELAEVGLRSGATTRAFLGLDDLGFSR